MHAPIPDGMMRMANGRLVPKSKPFGTSTIKTKKLLVVLQFWEGDRDAAEDLGMLIADLERTRNHEADVLLMNRADCRPLGAAVKAKLLTKFDKVMEHRCRRTDAKSHPHGPNQMFADLCMLMIQPPFRDDYFAFLNMEPDCTPTRPGWIGEMVGAWNSRTTGKNAVGYIHDDPVPHLNGVALWDWNILRLVGSNYLTGASPTVAFDIWHSKRILPHADSTMLMQFKYRQKTITPDELFGDSATALYHGVKDGSARVAVKARHITFTERQVVRLPENMTVIGATVQTDDNPPVPVAGEILLESPLGTQQLACGNRVPVENPVTISVAQELSPPAKRPNVYTYFSKVGRQSAEDIAIIEAWRKGWTSRGWNPVVLTLREAAKHPKFDEFSAAIEKLPCVGDRKKVTNDFNRWIALDSAGGGLLVDLMVLPNSFTPDVINGHHAVCFVTNGERFIGMHLSPEDSKTWVDSIIKYDAQPTDELDGKPHVTDWKVAARSTIENGTLVSTAPVSDFADTPISERKSVAMEKFLAGV